MIGTLRQMATRQEAERRPSGLMVALAFGIAIAAAVAVIVVAVVARRSTNAAPPSPTAVVDLEGIPQAGTVLGSPYARVTLIEYADLQCPSCRAYTEAVWPAVVRQYIRPGRVKTEFRGVAFIGPDSLKALRFVYAAGLQNRLWNLEEALYRNQGGENSGWVTDELVRRLAGEVGLNADRLFADAQSKEVTAMIVDAVAEANAAEVHTTPSLFVEVGAAEPYFIQVGSAAELTAALDDALSG